MSPIASLPVCSGVRMQSANNKLTQLTIALLVFIAWMTANAQEGSDEMLESEPEQVLVTGEQPGPRLWKVTHEDHVLWIMGGLSPLPKKMSWRSREVERVIASSQQVLLGMNVETDVGFFTKVSLLPSLMSVRKNPDKKKLADVVPPDTYLRWKRIKPRYLGKDEDVESWRPIFAAQKLYAAAIEKSGLIGRQPWIEDVRKLAKQQKVPVMTPTVELDIEKPRSALKEFKRSPLDDVECFQRTLERVENDVETMRLRANAWATGDVETLQALPYADVLNACANAVLSTSSAQKQGLQDLPGRLRDTWVGAAEAALRKNVSTLAVVPIDEVLKDDGWVAALVARGYVLEE
jgi:TraB/PrgY/gumN family